MLMMRLALIAAIAIASFGVLTVPAGAKSRNCNTWASYPNVKISSARNMSCAAARKDFKRYGGSVGRSFTTPGRFRCVRVSGMALGGQWRCAKGSKAYRFDFGD
jgi:hypothetical protein